VILFASLLVFLFSLLAIFHAPAYIFWIPALIVTEWGHVLVLVPVLLFWMADPSVRSGRWARGLSVAAALLLLTPVLRATPIMKRLPMELQTAWGPMKGAQFRQTPLSVRDLYLGVRIPPVQVATYSYAMTDGLPLLMDVYKPLNPPASLPAILMIHGGSWKGGSRKEFSGMDRVLAAHGYLVIAIDYRLAPRWIFPAARDDVFRAIDFLRQQAATLGWDRQHIALLGRSAGGQIALSAAYTGKDPAIRGVIALYAPNDLLFGFQNPGNPLILNTRKLISSYLGGTPQEIPDVYREASPLYATGPAFPPTLMIHGGRDELVWPVHEERLSRMLAEAHSPYFYLELPWATHGCDANLSGPSGQLSLYTIERFLAAVCR
jgi:acetyl esterase/lipase